MMLKLSAPTRAADRLPVGGFEPFSVVDWPGEICAVVFTQGCGWRCPYCHNPDLIPFRTEAPIRWSKVRDFLRRRQGLLDGVVFSGGEPTLHAALPQAMAEAAELGFRVGLHTGGPRPEALESLLPLLDWVGFDVKAPFDDYGKIVGRDQGGEALRSLRRLLEYGVPLEVRTTWHPALLSESDLRRMAATLASLGVEEWMIQPFRSQGCADRRLASQSVGDPPLERLAGIVVRVRR